LSSNSVSSSIVPFSSFTFTRTAGRSPRGSSVADSTLTNAPRVAADSQADLSASGSRGLPAGGVIRNAAWSHLPSPISVAKARATLVGSAGTDGDEPARDDAEAELDEEALGAPDSDEAGAAEAEEGAGAGAGWSQATSAASASRHTRVHPVVIMPRSLSRSPTPNKLPARPPVAGAEVIR
jgi:hypothetical protein